MLHAISNWLNERGRETSNSSLAGALFRLASLADPHWSTPWYNLGFQAKYEGRWGQSLRFNKRAAALSPRDQAGWWNLGIAATALRNWPEARHAWKAAGCNLPDGAGEVSMPPVTACVRLNPEQAGEVVWGERLDPARIRVLNVPLPESKRRYRDIILNDGAANGTRTWNGEDFPVFDELEVWERSPFSTFHVQMKFPDEEAEIGLAKLCAQHEFGVEDWSTIRLLCRKCSQGHPEPHECVNVPADGFRNFGLAARSRMEVEKVLGQWVQLGAGRSWNNLELALEAVGRPPGP